MRTKPLNLRTRLASLIRRQAAAMPALIIVFPRWPPAGAGLSCLLLLCRLIRSAREVNLLAHLRKPKQASEVRTSLLIILVWCFSALARWPGATISAAEPSYANKPLSSWLRTYQIAESGSAEENQAQAALRSIGTNCIPYLLRMLLEGDVMTQQAAANVFEVLGPMGAPAVPQLGKMLADTNEVVGSWRAAPLATLVLPRCLL